MTTYTAPRLRVYRMKRVKVRYQTPTERLRDALMRLSEARAAAMETPMRNLLIAAAERAVSQAAAEVAVTGLLPEAAALYASFADDVAAITLPSAEVTAEGVVAAINASQVLPEPITITDSTRILVRERAAARTLEMQGSRIGQWRAVVSDRLQMGWTPQQILDGGGPIPPEFEGLRRPGLREILGDEDYRGQAETIVRTESAYSRAETEVQAYAEQGIRFVRVEDGIEWDAPCIEANGQVWTVEEAASNPVQHPRCTRSFTPILDSDVLP